MKLKFLKALTAAILFLMPNVNFAQAPSLGTSANFVLLTTVGAITNSGIPHLTHLTGNVGSNSGSSTGFGNVDGGMHDGDGVSGAAAADLVTAYGLLNSATPTFFPSSLLGNGDTLVPGVYSIPSAATLTLNLVLNARGDPNALFIFQINGSLSVGSLAKVKIINGGLACNVFWKVEGLVSVASGSTMRGTIVAHNAAINLSALDTLEGRALSINGAITCNAILAYMPIGCGSTILTGPAAPPLVSTAAYGLLSGIGPVTNTGITHVVGDVGTNSGLTTGFNPLFVTGMIHPIPDASTAAAAGDLTNVYNNLNTAAIDIELLYPAQFGNDLVLTPHTYLLNAATAFIGNIYLNAEGHPNAVFIIHVNGALTTSTFSRVVLTNGTQAKNVYWLVNGAVHIFDNSLFNGTIVSSGAITLNTGDTLNGRAMTTVGAININASEININPAPCVAPPITGTFNVCPGSTTTLANSDTGGVWTSYHPLIATVGSSSGIVTGITPGTDTIKYTTLLACESTTTITVNPVPTPITGPNSVCVAATITLSNTSTGGTWSSSSTSIATVGSGASAGIVTGVAAGTANITYVLTTGCVVTKSITVNPLSNAGAISGASTVCAGSSTTLTETASGGVWSSSNTNATVSSLGVVNGVTAGTSTISYAVSGTCGTAYATKTMTITPAATAGTISGPSSVCPGSNITLTSSVIGGAWLSTNTATATITPSTGVVSGVTAGTTTISYTVTGGCGTATTTKTITVNPSTDAGTITGLSVVCVGSSITLSDAATGGAWTSSNAHTTVSGLGVVNGVSAGTSTISYAVSGTCGTAYATKTITITTTATAGTISGPSAVCTGTNITLTSSVSGGTWVSSAPATATITPSTGIVTGLIPGTSTITYTVTSSCGTATATATVTVNLTPDAGTITGLSVVCVGTSITLSDAVTGGAWTSSNTNATVSSLGVVNGVSAGTSTISYAVTTTCGTAYATKSITITTTATAGTISGPSAVCTGTNITLTSSVSGGTWVSSAPATATITPSTGVVTGLIPGTSTITYTVTSSCGTAAATATVTVNLTPDAGTITGLSVVCVGTSITLSDAVTGGAWTSSNTNATVSGAGVVNGVSAGTSTISYAVTTTCGTAYATKSITITTTATAGTISGPSAVCTGTNITLTSSVSGGTWVSSAPATATITPSTGVVTGLIPGTSTITYTVTSSCGTAAATATVTVNLTPDAGTITGSSVVCVGTSITLSDAVTGGAWTSSNTNATVSGAGVVDGVSAGTSTISYAVTTTCGTAYATKTITITTTATAGVISGPSSLCPGSNITLTSSVTGGSWLSSNTATATITSSTGIVGGVSAGTTVISYTVVSGCGTAVAIANIFVNPLPDAGTISGAATVCAGSSTALTETVFTGVWSSSSSNATVSASGVVNGITPGTSIISYSVTGACGTAYATQGIIINPMPNAGSITGASSVCTGTFITLIDATTGGVWNSSNANATVSGTGVVNGVTAGSSIISYAVTNSCGTAYATTNITINTTATAGVISGLSDVCQSSNITLTSSATGGVWSSSNTAAATITASTGIVRGVSAGTTTISYAVTNGCGTTTATKTITINTVPDAGSITGNSGVCIGATIVLSNTSGLPGGTWTSSNATATVLAGVVTGVSTGIDTIEYSVTNTCGTTTATKTITVNGLSITGVITGLTGVCVGSTITMANVVTGGIWSSSNGTATVLGNIVTGVTAGTDTIRYAITNGCGTSFSTKVISVNPLPVVPAITTQAPEAVCKGTMYQNFGTATLPLVNTVYNWSADNAFVWAQGSNHRYALVNFNNAGSNHVALNVTVISTGCSAKTTLSSTTGTDVAQTDQVSYFNNHFVCTPNDEHSYQWGYDDAITLDSTLLTGEINEDYINTNPDFSSKYYWVMTTLGNCLQKTYYHTPLTVQNINSDVVSMSLYPNPAKNIINVAINSVARGNVQMEIWNMMGQKVLTVTAEDNKATIDIAGLPAGSYMINCNRDGIKIAGSKFIKN